MWLHRLGARVSAAQDICISMKGLGKSFRAGQKTVEALKDLDLDVRRGEFLCLLGPSGCGKTTLLRCLAGIENSSGGRLEIRAEQREDGTPPAMVFQQHGLFPWMTVEGNLLFVLGASSAGTYRVVRVKYGPCRAAESL